MTFQEWLDGIASAYNVSADNISVTDTATEYIANLTPPAFTLDAINAATQGNIINTASARNIVELRILKSDITP